MQSDSSLLPNNQRSADNDESPPINPGVEATLLVGQHVDKRLAWLLWLVPGVIVLVGSLCDGIVPFHPEYTSGPVRQIFRGSRVISVFASFFFPRLADVHSRAVSGLFARSVLAIFADSVPMHGAGVVLYLIGSWGLFLLPLLFISDYTSLRWRGMALSGIQSISYLTIWIADPIYESMSREWSIGMLTIIMFVICATTVIFLYLVASRHMEEIPRRQGSPILKARDGFKKMDPVGLLIFTTGLALVDYNTGVWWGADLGEESPLALTGDLDSHSQTGRPGRVAMLIVGLILALPVFGLWEIRYASFPLAPKWAYQNRGVLLAVIIAFCFQTAYTFTSGTQFIYISLQWPGKTRDYYYKSRSISHFALAPILGILFLLTRRYKPYLILGSAMLVVYGYSVLGLYSVRISDLPNTLAPTVLLFAIQALRGASAVAIDLGTMVGSQASVPHNDLATLVGLINALPILAAAMSPSSYAAILLQISESSNQAFTLLFSLATGFSILCLGFSFFMPNHYLGDTHNSVEKKEDECEQH
ncbi:siderophore- iron [Rhizoctonia solani]|uniref:Siderophore- iron n=1 Tax=Rhizoctonia solani TaxID=456999 RepID=A0A8H7H3E1_9AGAM|nr:siderophore- iron [Rhizoctonia solani]